MLTAARKCTFSATCGRQHTNNMWTAPFVSLQVNKDTKISCVITTLWYKHTVAHPGVLGLALSLLTSYELPMTGYQNTDPPPPPCGCHRDLCVRNQIYIEEALFFSWHCQFYKLNYRQQKSTKIDIVYYVAVVCCSQDIVRRFILSREIIN